MPEKSNVCMRHLGCKHCGGKNDHTHDHDREHEHVHNNRTERRRTRTRVEGNETENDTRLVHTNRLLHESRTERDGLYDDCFSGVGLTPDTDRERDEAVGVFLKVERSGWLPSIPFHDLDDPRNIRHAQAEISSSSRSVQAGCFILTLRRSSPLHRYPSSRGQRRQPTTPEYARNVPERSPGRSLALKMGKVGTEGEGKPDVMLELDENVMT